MSGLTKHANTTVPGARNGIPYSCANAASQFSSLHERNLHVFGTDGNIVAVFEDVRYEAIIQKTLHSESTLHDRVDETAHTANHKLGLTELLN